MGQVVTTPAEDTATVQGTVLPIDNEPAPRLVVEPPLPGPLAQGVVFIPYRVENLRILPLAGPAARNLSPRVGHLQITVDDLPWFWADFGQSNTIVLAGMPRGQHKVRIELVDAEGNVFTAQTVTFQAPGKEVRPMKLHKPTMHTLNIPLAGSAVCLLALTGRLTAQEPTVTPLMAKALTNVPGKEVVMLTVEYAPGGADPVHRHNANAFVYVLEGSVVMQVKGGEPVTLQPGQTFYEGPDDVHVVGRNASSTKPAKFLVFLLKDKGAPPVVPVQ